MSISENNAVDSVVRRLVVDKSIQISDYMEEIGPNLLSEKPEAREEGLTKIVEVLTKLPHDFLTDEQVGLLLDFLLGRLEGSALAGGSVVEGIRHLVLHSKNLPENFEQPLFLVLFRDGNVQAWPQKERMKHYEIMEWLFLNREAKLKSLGSEVVLSFIKSVGGERDPRCLLAVFKMLITVTKIFPIEPFSEDLFEVMACYYPVEFKPLPGENLITKEMLAFACRATLVAHPTFAPFCFLLIEEKFEEDETTYEQKEELCNLITLAANCFSLASMLPFVPKLLGSIRSVALDPRNKGDLCSSVFEALRAIINSMEKNKSDKLRPAINTTIENSEMFVLQAEMGLSEKALALLRALAESCPTHQSIVFNQVFPWICTLVQGTTVNATANRIDICQEGLQFLREWATFARESNEVKALELYNDTIFASIDKAREYLPSLSIQSFYHCLKEYVLAECATESLIERGMEFIKRALKSTESEKERLAFLKFATVFAKFRSVDVIQLVKNADCDSDEKYFLILCSCIVDEKSWLELREKFISLLSSVSSNVTCLDYLVDTLGRLATDNQDVLNGIVKEFINFIIQSNQSSDLVETTLQSIGLLLEEDVHTELSKTYLNIPSFRLFVAQSEDPSIILEAIGIKSDDSIIPLAYSYINRTGSADDLSEEVKQQKWFDFIYAKSLIMRGSRDGITALTKIFQSISEGKVSSSGNVNLFDFKSNWYNPERCKIVSTILWKQRIMCQSVPFYIEAVVSADDKANILELLPPVLEFALELGDSFSSQMQQFLPVFIAALSSDGRLAAPVLKSLVSFVAGLSPELLDQQSVHKMVIKLCQELRMGSMMSVLDALKCLELIARRALPRNTQPFISLVSEATSQTLGHKKRVVRQAAAVVVNLWELLTTK